MSKNASITRQILLFDLQRNAIETIGGRNKGERWHACFSSSLSLSVLHRDFIWSKPVISVGVAPEGTMKHPMSSEIQWHHTSALLSNGYSFLSSISFHSYIFLSLFFSYHLTLKLAISSGVKNARAGCCAIVIRRLPVSNDSRTALFFPILFFTFFVLLFSCS